MQMPRHEEGIPDVTNGSLLRRDIDILFHMYDCAINLVLLKFTSREAGVGR
ncbi:HNH endonuclease [Escherichia coli]